MRRICELHGAMLAYGCGIYRCVTGIALHPKANPGTVEYREVRLCEFDPRHGQIRHICNV